MLLEKSMIHTVLACSLTGTVVGVYCQQSDTAVELVEPNWRASSWHSYRSIDIGS